MKECCNCKNNIWGNDWWNAPSVCLQCRYTDVEGETVPSNCKPMPMTNADRIRAMTDEELREFLCSITKCEVCRFEAWGGCELLKWLQQPAEGDA